MTISAADRGSLMRARLEFGDRPATGRRWPPGGRTLVGARGFEPPTSRSRTVRATRLRYAPTRPAYCTQAGSRLPRVLSDEFDELALAALARLHLPTDLLDQRQHLVHGVADRHHHSPVLGELLEERRWHRGAAGGDQDPGERRLVRPPERPAANADPPVRVAQLLAEGTGPLRRAPQPPDRAHAAHELLLHHLRAHELERVPHPRHYSLRARFRAVGRYWASRLLPKSASASTARWSVRSRWSGVIET